MSKLTSINPAYAIAGGDTNLAAMQVSGASNILVAEFINIDAGAPSLKLEQSIDGNAWGEMPDSAQVLAPGKTNCQWNINGLLVAGAFVRVVVAKAAAAAGIITTVKLLSDE